MRLAVVAIGAFIGAALGFVGVLLLAAMNSEYASSDTPILTLMTAVPGGAIIGGILASVLSRSKKGSSSEQA